MKKFLLLFVSILVLTMAHAQNIAGNWQGVLYQSGGGVSDIYPFMLTLSQNGTQITGTSEIRLDGENVWGILNLTGTINGNPFVFEETGLQSSMGAVSWCIKYGSLNHSSDNQSLVGPWFSASCNPGSIAVYRSEVLSPTEFCEDEPVELEVTGNYIRWFSAPNYVGFLGVGNQFTLDITESTTVYYSQTHDKIESPLVPVPITIVQCGSVSVGDNDPTYALQLLPNPASDVLRVEAVGLPGQNTYRVYSLQGALVGSGLLVENVTNIRLTDYPSGMYILEVEHNHGKAISKFVKQ